MHPLLHLQLFLTSLFSKLYSRKERYTYVLQDDCNLVKKKRGSVAGSIGVTIKKGSKGYGKCLLLWNGRGKGFMFAKGRPRAIWSSKVSGAFLQANNDGKLVAARKDGSVVGAVIQ